MSEFYRPRSMSFSCAQALVLLGLTTVGCDRSPAGPQDPAVLQVLEVSVVLHGNDEGSLDEPLAQIRAAAAVADSTIAIFDGITNKVTVVRRSGRIISQFGSEGDGPGEFRSVSDLQSHDGLVFAYDQQLKRITAFDLSGVVRHAYPTRNQSQLAGRNFRILDDQRYAIRDVERPPSGSIRTYYRMNGPGHADERELTIPSQAAWEGLPAILEFPFEPHVVSSLGPDDNLYFARTDRYEVLVARGERTDTIVGRRDPVAVLPAERDNYQAWADFVTSGGAPGTGPARRVAETKPLLRGLWCASDGTLVVELHTEGVRQPDRPARSRIGAPRLEWTETPLYDLYSAQGSLVGRLGLPLRSRILDIKLPSVWVSRIDSLDVPHLEHWTVGV